MACQCRSLSLGSVRLTDVSALKLFLSFFSQVLISSWKLLNQVIFIFQAVSPDSQVCLWSWITYNNLTAESTSIESFLVVILIFGLEKLTLGSLVLKWFYFMLCWSTIDKPWHNVLFVQACTKGTNLNNFKLIPCAEMKGKNLPSYISLTLLRMFNFSFWDLSVRILEVVLLNFLVSCDIVQAPSGVTQATW